MNRTRLFLLLGACALTGLAAAAFVWHHNVRGDAQTDAYAGAPVAAATSTADTLARGAYLARAGNCMGCHTARGGAPGAGGLAIATPFGTVYGPNLTPDAATGIGNWSSADFWRALHNGRAPDGRLLYPVFPYDHYTRVTRADADALYAYLMAQPPVVQPNKAHVLRFPYNTQAALAVWRALYFRAGGEPPQPERSALWNRGAYLVEGLGHCGACHTARNALGATAGQPALAGGLMPVQNWYAPALTAAHEAGVAQWELPRIVALLKNGVTTGASVSGPMAEVVLRSTQHLSDTDLLAMATYLQALPPQPAPRTVATPPPAQQALRGAKLYEQHCASCHGNQGEGVAGAYPALAGNRAVLMDPPANLVHLVSRGDFAPATTGNPRPFGMPPFQLLLNDSDLAAVLGFIRTSWGNEGNAVSEFDVARIRNTSR